jgi:CRISPR-associated protein Cmr1
MRKGPSRAPKAASSKRVSALEPGREIVEDERTYRFLTYVFGGGVKVDGARKDFDERTPIRVPSIRGQLRFWWRAVNPSKCVELKKLHARESEIFGSTSSPSPLVITVKLQPRLPRRVEFLEGKFKAKWGYENIAYGAFPLRDTDGNINHGVLHDYQEQKWTILLRYPRQHEEDVRAALWAWAHFGGLGGRTRRGFGAIEEVDTQAMSPSIDDGWARYVSGEAVAWPHIPKLAKHGLVISSALCSDGKQALDFLLRAMRELRQGQIGRKYVDGSNTPARSYWPEADAIRGLTGERLPKHKERLSQSNKFPRAAFGLPIIFQFKDKVSSKTPIGDPRDTTLTPKDKNRLASRLILRPHRAPNGDVKAAALVLDHPPVGRIVLSGKALRSPESVETGIHGAEEARSMSGKGRPSPLTKGDAVFGDPIDRYLEEIR